MNPIQAYWPDLAAAHAKMDALVKRIKYKPNWSLTTDVVRDYIQVNATATFQDSTLPTRDDAEANQLLVSRQIRVAWQIVAGWGEAELTRLLFSELLMGLERHEAQEWFRLDDEVIYDPHKEGQK